MSLFSISSALPGLVHSDLDLDVRLNHNAEIHTRRRRWHLLCLSHTDYHRPPVPRLQEGKRIDRPCWLSDLMVKYLRLRSLFCVLRSVIWR